MSSTVIWVIVGVVLIASEVLFTQFIMLFFGVGALITALVTLVIDSQPIAFIVFSLVSIVSLLLFRRTILGKMGNTIPMRQHKVDNVTEKYNGATCPYINQLASVTRVINPQEKGEVSVGGSFWLAMAEHADAPIEEGTQVMVLGWQVDNELILQVKTI